MKNKTITMYELMGLIKDGKAPKFIEYDNVKYRFDEIRGDYFSEINRQYLLDKQFETWKISTILMRKVKILPEENDEWEDIEELNYTLPTKHEHGKLFYKDGHNNVLRQIDITILEKINQLIKNQKYLKERLDKDELR